ncbi:Pentatricopeptide repeat-containing protein [Acorus calamus]|uniref:Pentatricopeptide repeat-containing protein n=1 Tax=Acorus calamus TaxID=4465 RepID=A0AAV9CL39_ACOCL|nr:Pentatricopeptide repeat-containing protein [Acorus calamus]
MFMVPSLRDSDSNSRTAPSRINRSSLSKLDERFIRILKIFKWGPDAEKALEVLMLRVDHRLVRQVLNVDDIDVSVKSSSSSGPDQWVIYGMPSNRWYEAIVSWDPPSCPRMLGQAKMSNKACALFYQVKGRKCKPNANAYNSIILMLMKEGHYEKVHELYVEMCNEGSCFPDIVTYDALVTAFGKLGRQDSALRLFEEIRLQPTPKIYTILIGMFFMSGSIDKALSLFDEMRESCCIPTVFTYTELIRGLGRAGRVDDAYGLFLDMRREGVKPDVVLMNTLISMLGKAGRVTDAFKIFNEMEALQCTPNVVTYNTLIKAIFQSRYHTHEAVTLFKNMKAKGIAPSDFTYSILIDGFCKTNRVEKALLLLEEMDEKGFPRCPAAYCSLINALGKAKRYDAANELFKELKENCGSSSSRVYAVMIKHLGKCRRLTDALDLEMKQLGCTPDVYAYNAVMSGLVRSGMIDEAHSMLRTMQEKDVVSYNTMLSSLSRAGMFEKAAKLMKEMRLKGFEYDRITYSSILEAIGQVDEE